MFFGSYDFILNFFAIFLKMRLTILTLSVILSFMKFCVARTFWVERHLDVVLEVLQVVGSKLVGIYHRKTHWKNYDDCLINEGDIQLFELWRKKTKYRSFQDFWFWKLKYEPLRSNGGFPNLNDSTTKNTYFFVCLPIICIKNTVELRFTFHNKYDKKNSA